MGLVKLAGNVDENGRLSAVVPSSIPPGPVTVLIIPTAQDDEEANLWTAGVAQEWGDELADTNQDIYTLADGEPVGEPT
jgi:hypothetical protein